MNAISATTISSTEVRGHFDYVSDGRAYGWAYSTTIPKKKMTIEILESDEVIGHGVADEFRQDLQAANIGDGYHMFSVQLSHELFDGQAHSLVARDADTGSILTGSPILFCSEKKETAYPQVPRALGLSALESFIKRSEVLSHTDRLHSFVQAYKLASRLQETGELAFARSAWNTINSALGENPIGFCKLGECLMLEENPAEALNAFQISAGADLRFHWAHLGIANSQLALSNFEEAEQALNVAAALCPGDINIRTQLAKTQSQRVSVRTHQLVSEDNPDAAISILQSFLLASPNNQEAIALLGDLLHQPTSNSFPGSQQLQEHIKMRRILESILDIIESQP
ncbi:hypothetical protein [Pseudomonas sp. CIP-10]|uniref:hypothetical protein n=1 Tax=Pseudomonas sp. CIP-10 TaxID=2892442 RepID=UPI001E5AD382|nr:hypothetical protein [Pseudomonas sp. CIP-10]UFH25794.1 hypothetical protein LMH93_20350 [Pseudomonas sp. CIP-10]